MCIIKKDCTIYYNCGDTYIFVADIIVNKRIRSRVIDFLSP